MELGKAGVTVIQMMHRGEYRHIQAHIAASWGIEIYL